MLGALREETKDSERFHPALRCFAVDSVCSSRRSSFISKPFVFVCVFVTNACVSLTRLETGVHTDAAVLFAVPRAHGVMPYKTICHAHPSQADGAPGISTISNTTQAARILLAAAAAAALTCACGFHAVAVHGGGSRV